MNTAPPSSKVAGRCTKLAMLDIYGFEVADHNGLEQLCINYCSEHVQQLFISAVLLEPQQEYLREGRLMFYLCRTKYRLDTIVRIIN